MAPAGPPSGSPVWWRFLPGDAQAASLTAEAVAAAGAEGKGSLARSLREMRRLFGAARTAALLGRAEALAGKGFGRPLRLLLASALPSPSLLDALAVGFALAGFSLDVRRLDGLTALTTALADEGSTLFEALDMTLLALGEGDDPRRQAFIDAAAASIAARSLAPVAVARFGGPVCAAGPAAPDHHPPGVAGLWIDCGGHPVLDRRFEASFGAILAPAAADRLADAAAAFAARMQGLSPKLLVTDLDGTFWDGVLGEGPASPGRRPPALNAAYATTLAALRDGGLVLAAASRNDPADVRRAFADGLASPVSYDDFAAVAAGWDDKAALVAAVLDRVGFSPEHAVLVDDDPVNCAKVAARFPGMDVRLFAGDPARFAAALAADPLLKGAGGGGRRAGEYRRKAGVEALRAATPDVGAFLRGLGTTVTVRPLDPGLLPRAAEVAARVNQFVFTAFRPNALQLAGRGGGLDFMLRLDDAFGAHGLVGLVLASVEAGAARIDNLFLSCRALERGIDAAMLAALGRLAGRRGLTRLVGRIEPLPRNEPARDCFSRHGFVLEGPDWVFDLAEGGAARLMGACAETIRMRFEAEEEGSPA